MYQAKDIRKLATVTEFNGEYFVNLEFIGRFKVAQINGWMTIKKNEKFLKIPIIKDIEIDEKIKSLSDDPLRIRMTIDNIQEGKRMKLLGEGNFRDAGFVKYNVTLADPIHVKKTFIKYDWLKENGFIGPDDILVLENEDQYGLYRNIRDFLNFNQDFIKAYKREGRVMIYKFSKYGVKGLIEKKRDGTGKMTIYSPDKQIDIQYVIRDEYSYINEIEIKKVTKKYYSEDIDDKENKRLIAEINNIIYSIGGDKYID